MTEPKWINTPTAAVNLALVCRVEFRYRNIAASEEIADELPLTLEHRAYYLPEPQPARRLSQSQPSKST